MAEQPPQTQIKIKITHPGARREEPVQEYVYHWDRIIGASTVLLLLLGGLGYGVYAWLQSDEPPVTTAVEEPQIHDQIVVESPPLPEQAVGAATPVPAASTPAAVQAEKPLETLSASRVDASDRKPPDPTRTPSEPPSEGPRKDAALAVVKTTPTPPSKAQDPSGGVDVGESLAGSRPQKVELKETLPPAALQEPAPVVAENGTDPDSSDVEPRRPQQEPRVDAASELSTADAAGVPPDKATDGAAEPGSGDVAADSGTPTRRGDHGLLRSPNVSIASPWVKRFLLAKDVVGNEPQGDIDDVALTDNGYAEVSSFSEVIDQKGETLQYRWLHEGREVLRIRVAVGANRWRSHSTKRIYAQMKGSWRAELRNSAGELLASIDFTF